MDDGSSTPINMNANPLTHANSFHEVKARAKPILVQLWYFGVIDRRNASEKIRALSSSFHKLPAHLKRIFPCKDSNSLGVLLFPFPNSNPYEIEELAIQSLTKEELAIQSLTMQSLTKSKEVQLGMYDDIAGQRNSHLLKHLLVKNIPITAPESELLREWVNESVWPCEFPKPNKELEGQVSDQEKELLIQVIPEVIVPQGVNKVFLLPPQECSSVSAIRYKEKWEIFRGGSISTSDPLSHPVIDLVRSISKDRETGYLCTDLYVVLRSEPCLSCAMALTHGRVKKVFILSAGASMDSPFLKHGLHRNPGLNHRMFVFHWG